MREGRSNSKHKVVCSVLGTVLQETQLIGLSSIVFLESTGNHLAWEQFLGWGVG